MHLESEQHHKIREYLKKHAPYSVVDRGLAYASDGYVTECSKSGTTISGNVLEQNDTNYSVQLFIVTSNKITADCSCCSAEDMQEQWCSHAVALLWRACDLDFFDASSGFAAYESTYRMNTSSPSEIAEVIRDVSSQDAAVSKHTRYLPKVDVVLDLRSDRLGVKIFFDGELQTSTIFGGFSQRSARSLDNLLLQVLEDDGTWDEDRSIWFINSSRAIETTLGLIQEYDSVVSEPDRTPVTCADSLLEAKLSMTWQESAVELAMSWVLPDGSTALKQGELLGTGPYWTVIDNTVYRISPSASRIASIFPYSSRMTITRSQVGPILEVIRSGEFDERFLEITNPKIQPDTEVKQPTANLELRRREIEQEHFASSRIFELVAMLEFEYPTPPENENVVYLPDREQEREHTDRLKALGFEYDRERRNFSVSGDAALDIVYGSSDIFPQEWKISGLAAVKKGMRFAELALNVSVASADSGSGKRRSYGIDWFDCHISLVQNNANVPLSMLFKNTRSDADRWVRLDSGAFAKVPGGGLNQLKTTLGILDPNFKLSNSIKTKLTSAQAIGFTRIEDEQFNMTLDRKLKALARKLQDFESIERQSPPRSFKGKLRPYQAEGLSWLTFLHDYSLDGILADEMGLGKTVQTLALLQLLKDSKAKDRKLTKPALVIAPTSVITNWLYEARRFAPKLKTMVLHGPQRKKLFSEIPEHDLVISSFALLRLDRYELERFEWSYIILDEAQNIKNPHAATTKAAKALRAQHRLALTGTPTENRPMELWSILDFLMPGYLGSHEYFRTQIEKPIIETGTDVPVAKFLRSKTKPFILRREKAEVEKDLPPKTESTVYVPMTNSQKELYGQILEEVRPKVFDAVEKRGVQGASVSILAALLRLRQVCNHPNSIDALKELSGYESGKFNLLKELVREAFDSGRKILLFSQFREMLAIIRRWLETQEEEYLYLDGATKNRQDLVDRFNADEKVRLFLISLKAGGTGLNLSGADTVIIYDPWWNPAVEGQAIDRAHRIGQTKKVSVYRLVTEFSIEQKIMDLKSKKAQIVDALINDSGLSTLKLSKSDLENFFSPFPVED